MNAIKTLGTVAKFAFIIAILVTAGYGSYKLTVGNYYTAQFVYEVVGQLDPLGESVMAVFVLSAIVAPILGFLLLLSIFAQEWRSPSSPEGLRAKAEALMREAAALERYHEHRRQELLLSARSTVSVSPRRGPR